MKLEESGKGETDIHEESGYDEKNRSVPEKVILVKQTNKPTNKPFTLNDLSEIFHIIESTKNKMSEADLNSERSVIVCQGLKENDCSILECT